MIAARAEPSGSYSMALMSSGVPSAHAENDGDATSPLRRIASSVRSFGGKKLSISKTPSLRNGGSCTWPISEAMSKSFPALHDFSMMLARRICSRLDRGSGSMSANVNRPETNPSISSRPISASRSQSMSGAASDPTTLTGTPAREPGV